MTSVSIDFKAVYNALLVNYSGNESGTGLKFQYWWIYVMYVMAFRL